MSKIFIHRQINQRVVYSYCDINVSGINKYNICALLIILRKTNKYKKTHFI